ncbi:MAG: response regulator [Dehalococcoidia bacterium]
MESKVVILLTEDDEGHALLIMKNLRRAGLLNDFIHFRDGQQTMDYLERIRCGLTPESQDSYILLLDLRLPKLDGTQILKYIKETPELSRIPVIVITTTDDPKDIDECHRLGCNIYISKPVDYERFAGVMKELGQFLMNIEVSRLSREHYESLV